MPQSDIPPIPAVGIAVIVIGMFKVAEINDKRDARKREKAAVVKPQPKPH